MRPRNAPVVAATSARAPTPSFTPVAFTTSTTDRSSNFGFAPDNTPLGDKHLDPVCSVVTHWPFWPSRSLSDHQSALE